MAEADLGCGSKNRAGTEVHRSFLQQEAVVVAFRRHTLLPLDDCLHALQATIPELTRSSLDRCLQRHDISRLPEVDDDRPRRKKFKTYPIGYCHIDIAEVRTEQGKPYLFVAIDRTSKFAYVEVHEKATQRVAADFLNALIQLLPYTIHTVLTGKGQNTLDVVSMDPGISSGFTQSLAGDPPDEQLIGPSSAVWGRKPGDYGHTIFMVTDGGTVSPLPSGPKPAKLFRLELQLLGDHFSGSTPSEQ